MHKDLFDLGQGILFWCILVQVVLVFGLDIYFQSVPLYLYMEGRAMELFGPVMWLQLSTRMLTSVLVKKTNGTVGHMFTLDVLSVSIKKGHIPVSYTHLTLPTMAVV